MLEEAKKAAIAATEPKILGNIVRTSQKGVFTY